MKAVLAGHDASGKLNPWVTDGTSAGTSELGIAGVASTAAATPTFSDRRKFRYPVTKQQR
jgi:hypothetical protein